MGQFLKAKKIINDIIGETVLLTQVALLYDSHYFNFK